MKTTRITILLISIVTLVAQIALAQGWGGGNSGNSCDPTLLERLEVLPIETISESEQAAMIHMREEEKLARDVYATLALKWNIPVFSNIARTEQRHMGLMAVLLDRYDIADPVIDDSFGSFSDPELSDLFESLVSVGETSFEQALRVGATIEDLDLADLDQLIGETDNLDVKLIAYNLAKSSRNHLRTFSRQLSASGFSTYIAQYLEQAQVDEIISSNQELRVIYDEHGDVLAIGSGSGWGNGRGNGRGRGDGWGNGRGKGRANGPGHGFGQGGRRLRDGSCINNG